MTRETSYKPEYDEQARKLCLLGFTDVKLADFFGVCEKTINNWKKEQVSFLQSLKAGKEIADGEVAQALYNRALGYSCPETKVFNNAAEPEKPITVDIVKHYPPDAPSMAIWLNNRQPELWRQRQTDGDQSADDTPSLNITFDVAEAAKEIKITNAKA